MSRTDWELYNSSAPKWRERYLIEKNKELVSILTSTDYDATDAFYKSYTIHEKLQDTLSGCLDGSSADNIEMSLVLMLRCGMITKDDIQDFSSIILNKMKPFMPA